MKKGYTILWSLMLVAALVITGCKKKVKSVTERIAKTWTAETVKEGAAVVYTRGGSGNTRPGYSDFKLTLIEGGNAIYVEFDKTSFSGKWELSGDTKLILRDLSPAPTGTNGVIEFTITSIDDSRLVLTRNSPSTKTGNSINVYTLSNP
ncbi:hypothetical protein [Dyadobacter sp. 32]|uniref:hypothetical protein n=1 Tax=Dyadobacter sp. 32 TaxID=538966 RepID=UPI0039C5C190